MAVFLTRDDKMRGRLRFAKTEASAVGSVCLLLMLFSAGCASARPRASTEQAPTAPTSTSSPRGAAASFITTFWCGPPLAEFDDARAAEIAAAGFTVIGPPCEGGSEPAQNRIALDIAARHGLKMWIADARFNERARTLPNWEAQIGIAAAEYKDHPAFGGYFVTDEPSAAQFEDLGAIVARLREVDPRGFVYLNLLADYFSFDPVTYPEYVERFITAVRPSILSYDYYPFGATSDRPTFFSNLALVRALAGQHDLPFMLILLAMPHGSYRDPTEAELSWQAFHALAFGARGISYFAYWTPVNVEYADVQKFRHGLIEKGKPTEHYFEAMRLNQAARAIAQQLASFRSVSVGDSVGEVAAALPLGPIASIEGAPVTAGLFADDTGQQAVLLAAGSCFVGRVRIDDEATIDSDAVRPRQLLWGADRSAAN
jgi:hypothetical protein